MRHFKFYTGLGILLACMLAFVGSPVLAEDAAPPDDASWDAMNGGSSRTTVLQWHIGDSLAVENQDSYVDSVVLQATDSDTSMWFDIAGADAIHTVFYMRAMRDTAAFTVNMDVGSDTTLASMYWTALSESWTEGFSADMTDDHQTYGKVWYTTLGDAAGIDNAAVQGERFGRFRVTARISALDTMVIKGLNNTNFPATPKGPSNPY